VETGDPKGHQRSEEPLGHSGVTDGLLASRDEPKTLHASGLAIAEIAVPADCSGIEASQRNVELINFSAT
jgi:hypothetical protein